VRANGAVDAFAGAVAGAGLDGRPASRVDPEPSDDFGGTVRMTSDCCVPPAPSMSTTMLLMNPSGPDGFTRTRYHVPIFSRIWSSAPFFTETTTALSIVGFCRR